MCRLGVKCAYSTTASPADMLGNSAGWLCDDAGTPRIHCTHANADLEERPKIQFQKKQKTHPWTVHLPRMGANRWALDELDEWLWQLAGFFPAALYRMFWLCALSTYLICEWEDEIGCFFSRAWNTYVHTCHWWLFLLLFFVSLKAMTFFLCNLWNECTIFAGQKRKKKRGRRNPTAINCD